MNKTEVVNVDLINVPHLKVELSSIEDLEDLYKMRNGLSEELASVGDIYTMSNKFEACFIVYREDAPHIFYYAQE